MRTGTPLEQADAFGTSVFHIYQPTIVAYGPDNLPHHILPAAIPEKHIDNQDLDLLEHSYTEIVCSMESQVGSVVLHGDLVRQLHGLLGMLTELGELADAYKRMIFYKSGPLDRVNLVEEVGDINWYLTLFVDAIKSTPEEMVRANVAKLKRRYKKKFTAEAAIERDLEAERAELEQETGKWNEEQNARYKAEIQRRIKRQEGIPMDELAKIRHAVTEGEEFE